MRKRQRLTSRIGVPQRPFWRAVTWSVLVGQVWMGAPIEVLAHVRDQAKGAAATPQEVACSNHAGRTSLR